MLGRSLFLAGLVAAAATGSPVLAQSQGRIPIPYRTYIAINPLSIPFDIASAEVESGIANGITIGAAASYTAIEHKRFTTVDAKLRYYPSEVVLDGLSIGLSVGRTHFTNTVDDGTGQIVRQGIDYTTIGLLGDYNWLAGTRKRFVVGTGVGLKRVLGNSEERKRLEVPQPVVTFRFVLGLAF